MTTLTVTAPVRTASLSGPTSLRTEGSSKPCEQDLAKESSSEEVYQFAAPYDAWIDPERFWAGNVENWDYAQGNPINSVWQGQNTAIRPNNGNVVFLISCGVYVIGVSTNASAFKHNLDSS
jgi:hypothetical protein